MPKSCTKCDILFKLRPCIFQLKQALETIKIMQGYKNFKIGVSIV